MKRLRTEGIVIHRAEVFTTTDYHFIIMRDGSLKQLCPIEDKAEHAIYFNGNTIAIAVYGCFASLEPALRANPTDEQLAACIKLMKDLNKQYGGKLWASGHSQLGPRGTSVPSKLTVGHTCPGERFPLADVIAKSGLRVYPLVLPE